jgi:hypothetical protein
VVRFSREERLAVSAADTRREALTGVMVTRISLPLWVKVVTPPALGTAVAPIAQCQHIVINLCVSRAHTTDGSRKHEGEGRYLEKNYEGVCELGEHGKVRSLAVKSI